MRLAGVCFILIALSILIDFAIINEYLNSTVDQFQSSNKIFSPEELFRLLRVVGIIQIFLLFLAGIGLLMHGAMNENKSLDLFSKIEQRLDQLENIDKPDTPVDSAPKKDRSDINSVLGV